MEPIGAHLTLMSVQITASASAPVQIMTTLRFQIVQTLFVPITSPQRVWCCVFTVHVIPHVPLKPIGTHLTVETLLHHVFIVHVIPHVSIGAHLTVHMSTVFHMWTVKWAHCVKQTLLFVITTLKVCWCDAACHHKCNCLCIALHSGPHLKLTAC